MYCSVYCLCVNVYCTSPTGCQPKLQLTNISYVVLTRPRHPKDVGKIIGGGVFLNSKRH